MKKLMYTITGPSCAGKTTLMETLLKRYPNQFARLVSDTTRAPRTGETNGEEYAFVSEEEFKQARRSGLYCQTVHYAGTYYGTRQSTLEDIFATGKVPVRVVEPTGVGQFREVCQGLDASVVAIFVDAPLEEIVTRWLGRVRADHPESDRFYAYRIIKTFQDELAWVEEPIYDYYYNCQTKPEIELLYELTRIASGNIPLSTVLHMSPNPHEQTA